MFQTVRMTWYYADGAPDARPLELQATKHGEADYTEAWEAGPDPRDASVWAVDQSGFDDFMVPRATMRHTAGEIVIRAQAWTEPRPGDMGAFALQAAGGAALWGVLLGHMGLRPQPPGCVPLVREVRGRWPKGATDITWVGADGVA